MENEERFRRIEEATLMMEDLLVRHEERLDAQDQKLDNHHQKLDEFYKAMETSREDFEFKLNALIDAQMQNEIGIRQLKEASQSHLQRIEKLENN